jgi:hypothetical protein
MIYILFFANDRVPYSRGCVSRRSNVVVAVKPLKNHIGFGANELRVGGEGELFEGDRISLADGR